MTGAEVVDCDWGISENLGVKMNESLDEIQKQDVLFTKKISEARDRVFGVFNKLL